MSPAAFTLGLALVLTAVHGVAGAAPRWVRDVAARPSPAAPPDADGVVLCYELDLEIDAHLTLDRRERIAVRILRSQGLDDAAFAFLLEPGARLKSFQAWTLTGDDVDQAGRDQVVFSTQWPGKYTDTQVAALVAPNARVGSVVVAEIVASEPLPFPSYTWSPQYRGLASVGAECTVRLPREWTLATRSTGVSPQQSVEAGKAFRLVTDPMSERPDETDAPPASMTLPHCMMRFAPPEGAAFGGWSSVASWYYRLAADRFAAAGVPAELAQRAANVDRVASLLAAAREVQHSVSYAAIELGEQRWQPDLASVTWERRYGDCKDKAILLASALEANGIEARPVLTCTRDHQLVDPEWPDPTQFNHCIVAFVWPGDGAPAAVTAKSASGKAWTFFDPTDPSTPFGLLPAPDAGAWAVIADPGEGLIQLPEPVTGRVTYDVQGALSSNGACNGSLRLTASGPSSGRLALAVQNGSDKLDALVAGMLRLPERETHARDFEWTVDSLAQSATLVVKFQSHMDVRNAGGALLLSPSLPASRLEPPPAAAERALPFWLGWPRVVETTITLALPPGYRVAEVPSEHWTGAAGRYDLDVVQKDATLVLTRHMSVHDTLVPAGQHEGIADFIGAMYRGDHPTIVLRRGAP